MEILTFYTAVTFTQLCGIETIGVYMYRENRKILQQKAFKVIKTVTHFMMNGLHKRKLELAVKINIFT